MNIKACGYGFGKTILFGEHFVVYGFPAIVSALRYKTKACIEKIHDRTIQIIDKRLQYNKKCEAREYLQKAYVQKILNLLNIKDFFKVILGGDLPIFSGGIGASAAFATSVTRAVNSYYNLNLDDKKINDIAFQAESIAHGTPSGIDNVASVYGGTFLFKKKFSVQAIKLQNKIEVVLVDSGDKSSTKDVVVDVKKFKEENEKKFAVTSNEYLVILEQAKHALINFDLKIIGQLMVKNHELLKQINVSSDKLDSMVEIAINAGAFGAKLTGTGKGGLVLALTPGKNLQEKVASVFEKEGFSIFKTEVG
jgi:mevalonate kinase